MPDCIQAQITAAFKTKLRGIRKNLGYAYDVAAVEEARNILEINQRFDFILLLENEPIRDDDDLIISELQYPTWFFSAQNDKLVGNPTDVTKDLNTEIAYYNRNAVADITKAVCADPYLVVDGVALCECVDVIPGTHSHYVDDNLILFGTWCLIKAKVKIDAMNPYQLK